jgi:hypothetical protein
MMPKISWPQRVVSDANGRGKAIVALVIVGSLRFLPSVAFSRVGI